MPILTNNSTIEQERKKILKVIEKSLFFSNSLGYELIESSELKTIPIDEVEFPIRFYNAIKTYNSLNEKKINNLLDLLNTGSLPILAQPNCGSKSYNDVKSAIRYYIYNDWKKLKYVAKDVSNPILSIKLNSIKLPPRFLHHLELRTNLQTIGDLQKIDPKDFLKYKNLGKRTIAQTYEIINNIIEKQNPEQYIIGWTRYNNNGRNEIIISEDILNIELNKIDFSVRVKNFLEVEHELKTIRNLLDNEPKIFLRYRNTKKNSLSELYEKVKKVVTTDEYKKYLVSNLDAITLPQFINDFLEGISKREKSIVIKRWGVGNGKTQLATIGEEYHLTRERIRQILGRLLRRFRLLIKQNEFEKFCQKKFLEILSKKPEPIDYLDIDNGLFDNRYGENFYLGFLSEIFTYVPFAGYLLKNLELSTCREGTENKRLNQLYANLCKIEMPYKTITSQAFLEKNILYLTNNYEKLLLYKIILSSKRFLFKKIEDKYYLCKINPCLEELVGNILLQSDKALHINELMNIIKNDFEILGKYKTIQSFLSFVQRIDGVYQLDRYLLGLLKHFSYPKESWEYICFKAKEFMKIRGKQLYVKEILDGIKKDFPLLKSKFELVHILRSDSGITDLEFFTFNIKENKQGERLKAKDLINRIFTNNEKPKHIKDIFAKILVERHFRFEGMWGMLKQTDFLKSYPGGFYGLKNRQILNLNFLSKDELFAKNFLSDYSFPDTRTKTLKNYFEEEELKLAIEETIKNSDKFYICQNDNMREEFVIVREWSIFKITRCILYNRHEEMFWDEIKWILSDLGIADQTIISAKSKIYNDGFIKTQNNKLLYLEIDLTPVKRDELVQLSYSEIKKSKEAYRLGDLYNFLKNQIDFPECGIDYLGEVIKKDSRFLVSQDIIMVKS